MFDELARVLRPGGRIALLDVARPERALMRAGHSVYLGHVAPLIGSLLSDRSAYHYLPRSAWLYLPEPRPMLAQLRRAGFARPVERRLLVRRDHPAPTPRPAGNADERTPTSPLIVPAHQAPTPPPGWSPGLSPARPGTGVDLLAVGGASSALLWRREGLGLAGRGRALRIPLGKGLAEEAGPERALEVLASIKVEDDLGLTGCGPLALGALPFDRRRCRRPCRRRHRRDRGTMTGLRWLPPPSLPSAPAPAVRDHPVRHETSARPGRPSDYTHLIGSWLVSVRSSPPTGASPQVGARPFRPSAAAASTRWSWPARGSLVEANRPFVPRRHPATALLAVPDAHGLCDHARLRRRQPRSCSSSRQGRRRDAAIRWRAGQVTRARRGGGRRRLIGQPCSPRPRTARSTAWSSTKWRPPCGRSAGRSTCRRSPRSQGAAQRVSHPGDPHRAARLEGDGNADRPSTWSPGLHPTPGRGGHTDRGRVGLSA